MPTGGAPAPWGPMTSGRTRFRWLHRIIAVVGMVSVLAGAAAGTTAYMLYQEFEENRNVVALEHLDGPEEGQTASTSARHFLLVGSDGRDGLSREERRRLTLGNFDGQRSDTVIYVTISADREHISLVSLPRDLLVNDEGRQRKLTDVYAGGADALVKVVQDNFGLPVNHYVEISIGGFVEVVNVLGGVELCLEEPLVDRDAGADLEAGCLHRTPEEALAFVRSRKVDQRGDYARIDRQQHFMRQVLGELSAQATFTNPGRLFDLVDDLAEHVTTDSGLSANQIRGLAGDLRAIVEDGDLPMVTVPSYNQMINGGSYELLYRPGAEAMFDKIRAGEPLTDRGTTEERAGTRIALAVNGHPNAASTIERTLLWGGFTDRRTWQAPEGLGEDDQTIIYLASSGKGTQAGWVGALLGAEVRDLPPDVEAPSGTDVIVVTGGDADPNSWNGAGDAGR